MNLNAVLAANLRLFMSRPGCLYPNANSLSTKSGVSANTIRNLLDPAKRPTTVLKSGRGSPTLDKIEAIAEALGCGVWELLHPNLQRAWALLSAGEAAEKSLMQSADPRAARALVANVASTPPVPKRPAAKRA